MSPEAGSSSTTSESLARSWWLMATRGGFALVFGGLLLAWSEPTLSIVVTLFGAYAVLDGLWALGAAAWASRRSVTALAVGLEGLVSLGLGVLALAWPFVPREFIQLVAGWGVFTGILEIVAAAGMPRETAGHWLLGTAGVCSLFLAVLVLMVATADVGRAVTVIAGYAMVFGVMVVLAALRFRSEHPTVAAAAP